MPVIDPVALRVFVYDETVGCGTPPRPRRSRARFDRSDADARQSISEVEHRKDDSVDPKTGEIWMAGPFSAGETPYRVVGENAASGGPTARGTCSASPMIANERVTSRRVARTVARRCRLSATRRYGLTDHAVVHFLLPASRWYDDIGFT